MVSLYDSFAMFPAAHHPHHPHHSGVVGGVMGPGGGVGPVGVGHSTTPPHHAHHHHHHAAAAIHNLTARHHSQGPPPPSSSSVAGQLNLHHAGHHQGPHHPHSHLNSHHQMAANQAAYFGYPHPHHWGSGGGGGGQGVHHQTSTAPNAAMEHQQQFQVGGLVTADGGNSWHPSPAAVYSAGLSSSLSPRTPVASVGYEEWVNSPSNNNGQQQQGGGGGVSSPDASPHFVQQPQGGGNAANGPSSPLSDQQQLSSYSVAAAAAYGKLFASSGGSGDFISPHHAHLHHPHHHNNHAQMVDPHRMNAGVVTGHHSPDSGLAGSDGLSSAGSPAQQQQQGMLGGGSSGNNLLNLQQQQQQQQNTVAAQGAMTGPSSGGSMSQQNQQQLVGSNGSAMGSRPQAAQSPYGWMKKPSYHNNNVNPESDVFSAGKTRTKDKYRVVYTDHQRLELEKEFHYSRYITIRRKSELASVLGLSERQVKIWFQNRRAKERKQVKKREEMLHKEKLDVVPSLGAVQQQQQQHHLHSGQQQQHMQHMAVQHPGLVSNPQISSSMQQHMGSVVQLESKPILGLD
ncbi:homeotic protein caudal-like isoform X1 [Daphnia carinata]|uniref:homeotic protein caudal-like isoform X1 n=1 Tax=Daphnia carinata TaxID=120202 RepID=UPI00257C31B0|nr:homeotic protein caudal-like isoform X1 [Daphnia carinata]